MSNKLPNMTIVRLANTRNHHALATSWCINNLGVDGLISRGLKWRRDASTVGPSWEDWHNDYVVYDYTFANDSDAVMFKLAWV